METHSEPTSTTRPSRAPAWLLGAVAASCLCPSALVASAASAQDTAASTDETPGEEVREELHEAHEARWHHPRLRFGASGLGGGFVGATHGGVGGVALRIGVQLDDVVAIYLQGQGLVGEYVPDPRPTSITGFWFHEAMIDFTLLDMIQLGGGPSIDVIWGCDVRQTGGYCGRSGAFFGGNFRVAILLHRQWSRHRAGVVFSIDAHPTWVTDELLGTLLFGIGGELY